MMNMIEKRDTLLAKLAKANTLEEIIATGWQLEKCGNTLKQDDYLDLMKNKKDEFYYEQIQKREQEVRNSLLLNFVKPVQGNVVDLTAIDTKLAWWEIREILLKKQNKDEIDEAFLAYTLKVYPQNDLKERQLTHRIEEAKAKINIYLEADCPSPTDLKKMYGIQMDEIIDSYKFLRSNAYEFYDSLNKDDFMKEPKEFKGNGYTKQIITEVASLDEDYYLPKNHKNFVAFCEQNDLPTSMVRRYCRLQKAKNSDFFKLDLAKQVEQLSLVKLDEVDKVKPLAAQLVDVFDENTDIDTIDYHYFYKQKLNKDEVFQFLRAIKLDNIAEKFRKYVVMHPNAFTCYDAKEIAMYSKNFILTFENQTVNYEPANFVKVINELEEENLPMSKGLIVQKLTEKQNSKKITKSIVKPFQVC